MWQSIGPEKSAEVCSLTCPGLKGQVQWPVEGVTQLLEVLWCSRPSAGSKVRAGMLSPGRKPRHARRLPSMESQDTQAPHRDASGRISRRDGTLCGPEGKETAA